MCSLDFGEIVCNKDPVLITYYTSKYIPGIGVLPRPFLQGAALCPFLVTPCLFLKSMTPCLFFTKNVEHHFMMMMMMMK